MVIFRLVFGLLLLGAIACFGMYVGTREPIWRQRGVRILLATIVLGLLFFAGLTIERLL
jgi:hypothetical protein